MLILSSKLNGIIFLCYWINSCCSFAAHLRPPAFIGTAGNEDDRLTVVRYAVIPTKWPQENFPSHNGQAKLPCLSGPLPPTDLIVPGGELSKYQMKQISQRGIRQSSKPGQCIMALSVGIYSPGNARMFDISRSRNLTIS